MGRDISGRKDRDGRMGGCEAQIVSGAASYALGVSFFFFFLNKLKRASIRETVIRSNGRRFPSLSGVVAIPSFMFNLKLTYTVSYLLPRKQGE